MGPLGALALAGCAADGLPLGAANDGGPNDLHAIVDVNGMPASTPLYTSPLGLSPNDPSTLSASCNPPAGRPATPAGIVCGDWAVNTTQPFHWPYAPGTADAQRLPPLSHPTIGDRLSEAGIDWAWYSGGWSNANGDVGGPGWMGAVIAVFKPFFRVEMKHFDPAEETAAWAWIGASEVVQKA